VKGLDRAKIVDEEDWSRRATVQIVQVPYINQHELADGSGAGVADLVIPSCFRPFALSPFRGSPVARRSTLALVATNGVNAASRTTQHHHQQQQQQPCTRHIPDNVSQYIPIYSNSHQYDKA
jgi:hypothetical protein